MDRDRLLSQEEEAWLGFVAIVDRLDADRIDEPSVTPEGWSVRDELVHIAAWLEDCARVLGSIGEGSYDPATAEEETAGYVERANADHAVRARTMPAAAARPFLEEARRAAREAFLSLPDVDALAWGWFEESGPMHYAEHGHDLLAWAEGTSSDPEVGPLLQEETSAWVPFAWALDALSPESPVTDPPGWTASDVAFHIAAWMEMAASDVAGNHGWTLAGGDEIVDGLNERFLAEGRSLQPDAVRERLEAARTRLRAALSATVAPSAEAKAWFQANGAEHYAEHVEALRRSAG